MRDREGDAASIGIASDPLTKAMNALAELGAAAAGSGAACLISWQRLSNGGAAYAPADSRWEPALWAILGLLWRRDGAEGIAPNFSLRKNAALTKPLAIRMSAAEVALRCGRAMPVQTRLEALGVACPASPTAQASVVLLMPQGIPVSQSDALIELIQRQALAELALSEESASLWFWRDRAATAAERLATERATARRERDTQTRAERAIAAARKLKPRDRWSGLGKLFAASGPFAAWIVAVAQEGAATPSIVATSAPKWGAINSQSRSALAEAIRRRATIVRGDGRDNNHKKARGKVRVDKFAEDLLLDSFDNYLCVPFDGGAVVLAASKPLDPVARERAEALAVQLAPVSAGWIAEERLAKARALVHELGVRLFAAADTERARIARDLHDDQAQLLAAAQLALDGGADEARTILDRLQTELRQRLHELRPATLGERKLSDALRDELARLSEAGIGTQLIGAATADRLPAGVRQICFQVAREALANVARHAHATHVEVRVERHVNGVRLIVSDNGCGVEPVASNDADEGGMGLKGLAERLEHAGGAMRFESRKGLTRLISEIPL
jgi:signal transduction histidine kinase